MKLLLSYGLKEIRDNNSQFQLSERSLLKEQNKIDTNLHSNQSQAYPTMTSGTFKNESIPFSYCHY